MGRKNYPGIMCMMDEFNSLISLAIFFWLQFELHFHLRAEIGGTGQLLRRRWAISRGRRVEHRLLPAQLSDRLPLVLALAGRAASRVRSCNLSHVSLSFCPSSHEVTEEIVLSPQHIDKVFKHKELQQQLVDAKLQQTTQLIKEADEKHQREREFVSAFS